MPLTTSTTDKAIHELLKNIAGYYKPSSTNSKPMYEIERQFVTAINTPAIRKDITLFILNKLKDYE